MSVPESMTATVESVTVPADGKPVVHFKVNDAFGRGGVGLKAGTSGQVRFTFAKLTPPLTDSGNSSTWQSYVNSVSTWDAGSTMQATYDRTGTLADNGDGTYVYTFATNVTTATNPVDGSAITYDPALTHRLVLQISGGLTVAQNIPFDFVPNGSAISFTRDVVDTASCNECHGKLQIHGSRYEAKYCVTCHNPGTKMRDQSVDMKVFIHKIHMGEHLPSVVAGGKYILEGSRGSNDFSHVTYPQPLNNCRKCHNGDDGAAHKTAQGNNWKQVPSREACGSCHDDIDFDTNANGKHEGGAPGNNQYCRVCHPPNLVEQQHAAETKSPNAPTLIVDNDGKPLSVFAYDIKSVTDDGARHPVVTFKITRDGNTFDPTTALPSGGISDGPSFLVAYAQPQGNITAPGDYNNQGRSAGQPASVKLADLQAGTAGSLTGPDADGYYTATFSGANAWPTGATLRAIALQGYFSQTVTKTINHVTGPVKYARHTPSVVKAHSDDAQRRVVTVNAKCLSCHESLELHGGNRVNEVGVCVTCHNPNLTSSGRGTDPAQFMTQVNGTPDGGTGDGAIAGSRATYQYFYPTEVGPPYSSAPVDPLKWPETSLTFRDLVHGIHGSHLRSEPFVFVRDRQASGVYAYDWSEVTFPQVNGNCAACHTSTGYSVNLPANALPSTQRITTGNPAESRAAILGARGSVPNTNDLVTSPTASACLGCHDSPLAKAHMSQNGGSLSVSRGTYDSAAAVETCAICHGAGKVADVAQMHPLLP